VELFLQKVEIKNIDKGLVLKSLKCLI